MPPLPPAPASGTLPAQWIHGSAHCATNTDPPLQIHRYDADTFILRQNKCLNFEAPFLYLLFGEERALLQDTGATPSPAQFPVGAVVREIIRGWLAERGRTSIPLVVAHSHSHGDHLAGDAQFAGQPNTTVVPPGLAAVKGFFGITIWPGQIATAVCVRVADEVPALECGPGEEHPVGRSHDSPGHDSADAQPPVPEARYHGVSLSESVIVPLMEQTRKTYAPCRQRCTAGWQ